MHKLDAATLAAQAKEFYLKVKPYAYGTEGGNGVRHLETESGEKMITYYENGFHGAQWRYWEMYATGEPYAGMIRLFRNGRLVYVVTYDGAIYESAPKAEVEQMLARALLSEAAATEWRGVVVTPSTEGDLVYYVDQDEPEASYGFDLNESICRIAPGELACTYYKASFRGRLVNQF